MTTPKDEGTPNVNEKPKVNGKSKRGMVFLTLGLAFVALGAAGQRAFLFIGIAFLIIGIVGMTRRAG